VDNPNCILKAPEIQISPTPPADLCSAFVGSTVNNVPKNKRTYESVLPNKKDRNKYCGTGELDTPAKPWCSDYKKVRTTMDAGSL
jgi:hypothetical protein